MSGRVVMLPRAPEVSAVARATVRELSAELGRRVTDDACLLVSELATNALLHGRGRIRLRVEVDGTRLHLAVFDDGDGEALVLDRPGDRGGSGLRIVERLADRWGTGPERALVWCELDLPAPANDGGRVRPPVEGDPFARHRTARRRRVSRRHC